MPTRLRGWLGGGHVSSGWWPAVPVGLLPVAAYAAVPGGEAGGLSDGWPVLAVLAAAGLAWLVAKRTNRPIPAPAAAPTSEGRLSSLLAHSDCLLWEAEVFTAGDRWEWKFTLQPSGLAQRIFAGIEPPWDIGTWNGLNVPEKPEMDRRCHEAMRAGLKGYEQSFRLIRPDGVMWLHESVSIVPTDAEVGKALEVDVSNFAQISLGGPFEVEAGRTMRLSGLISARPPVQYTLVLARGQECFRVDGSAMEQWKRVNFIVKTGKSCPDAYLHLREPRPGGRGPAEPPRLRRRKGMARQTAAGGIRGRHAGPAAAPLGQHAAKLLLRVGPGRRMASRQLETDARGTPKSGPSRHR